MSIKGELIAAVKLAHVQGRTEDVERLARQVLKFDPDEPSTTMILGVMCMNRGNLIEAESWLRRSMHGAPKSFEATLWLVIVLRTQGRTTEALDVARLAVQLKSDDVRAQYQLALCCLESGDFAGAEAPLHQAITLDPKAATLYELLGRALQAMLRDQEAVAAYKLASKLSPDNERVLYQLAVAQLQSSDCLAAITTSERILSRNPQSLEARLVLAQALLSDQRGEEALASITQSLDGAPGSAQALLVAGQIMQDLGRFEEGRHLLEQSIEINPRDGFAYETLVNSRRISDQDLGLVQQMERVVYEFALPNRDLVPIHYALGKAYDDLASYEQAMTHYDQANRIDHAVKFGTFEFDRESFAKANDALIETFTPAFFLDHNFEGNDDQTPVLVVGMMRSGTTLVNQILSSHPEVGSVGEQIFWRTNQNKVFNFANRNCDFSRLEKVPAQYLDLLKKAAPGKSRVVDKMPDNYSALGVFHLTFPKARIVHVHRNPMDTCISIYATRIGRIGWANDKENIVFAYRQYERLISHWRRVLPSEKFCEVSYEDLVLDRERTSKKLVDFCGLEWDEACLRPERNQKLVTTPSAWQIRQPVYTSSIGRWRHYEPWLGAFRELADSE